MRRSVASIVGWIVLVGCQTPFDKPDKSDYSALFDGSGGHWTDLTYSYSEETIYWPTADGFRLDEVAYGETEAGYFYSAYNISTAEHGGTHLDAPIHFSRGGMSSEQIPLERLIAPAVVVDVSANATPDYRIDVADLETWERIHGRIPDGAILLIRTGWGERWPDRRDYLGTERTGPEAVSELHFPGIHEDAARWIVHQRKIAAVGIDTPSLDYGQSRDFEAHVILCGGNIPGFENVANLHRLPEKGAFVVALPMKVAGGSGGPLRIVAFIPRASGDP
jgi:kynurenine formamidase